jgi:hypothetical protein
MRLFSISEDTSQAALCRLTGSGHNLSAGLENINDFTSLASYSTISASTNFSTSDTEERSLEPNTETGFFRIYYQTEWIGNFSPIVKNSIPSGVRTKRSSVPIQPSGWITFGSIAITPPIGNGRSNP